MSLRHMRIWRYVDQVARAGSIRQAAESLHVTPSAVQRRIQDLEIDLKAQLFERSASGMRLTAAGEIFLRWIRSQEADLDRVRSQIEALAGLRRGRISIACSQALALDFLPAEIAAFQARYPQVTFDCSVRDHESAIRALIDFEVDLVLVFKPSKRPELQPLMSLGQRLVAIMRTGHPLCGSPVLRLRDCARYPTALPATSFGARQILDDYVATATLRFDVVLQSNSFEMLRNFVRRSDALTFQIEIGTPSQEAEPGLSSRPVDDRDLAHGPLVLGQLKGRTLPVAAASFAEQLARSLDGGKRTPLIDA